MLHDRLPDSSSYCFWKLRLLKWRRRCILPLLAACAFRYLLTWGRIEQLSCILWTSFRVPENFRLTWSAWKKSNGPGLTHVFVGKGQLFWHKVSNTDGLFTMANSNSFLSPWKILLIAQESKYLYIFNGIFLFLSWTVCCVCSLESPHRGDSNEYTHHIIIIQKIDKTSLNDSHCLQTWRYD